MKSEWKRTLLAASLVAALGLPTALPSLSLAADRDDVPAIVSDAKVVKESSDAVSFKLPEKGQVWLYDATDKKVLHSIELNEGNTYGFNTKEDRVYVNEKEGPKVRLDRDHSYRIYYVTVSDRDTRHRDNDRDRDHSASADRASARVPDSAKVVAEGRDEELSYKAKDDGVAYLWDNTNNRVINTFNLSRGDRITVSPKSNAVAVNEKTIRDIDLSRRSEYRLLFDEGRTR